MTALMPIAQLILAGKNADLVVEHNHEGWVVKNRVSCPRCQAEDALLAAGRDVVTALQLQPKSP